MANTTNWLNISAQSGSSGETILSLSAQRNLSTDYKYAEITAYNPVYNISAKTYVSLASYQPFINVAPAIVGVPETGGTYELSITANCAYVIAYPDLVSSYSTSAATGNTTITFSVSGTYEETTLVGNIVITDESGQVSRTVRVEQYGGGAELVYAPGVIYIDSTGGNAYFAVSANCPYTITKLNDPDWFSVSPTSGYTGRTEFVVTAGENTGSTDVTGYISINGPGSTGGVVEVIHKKAETRLVVGYYVTSTTEPTAIMNASGLSSVSKAELRNGTQITPATAYTFPATGMQYVYYTLTGTSIPNSMFSNYGMPDISDTVRTVSIPKGITVIDDYAFEGDSSLSSITIPEGVTRFGGFSFYGCSSLSSITIPDSVISIGAGCFSVCFSLSSITIPSGVTSIGAGCFFNSSVSSITFTSLTPPTLGSTDALSSSSLTEIIVPCQAMNDYLAAWPQYEQYMSCQDTELYFVTDTSNVKGIGETRTITILNTNINENRTGLDLPGDFPAVGSYTVSGNKIYLTYPANPSSSSTRTWRIGVVAQTNDGVSLKGYYTITQNALQTVPIPYTADTSTVNKTGETRTITIDTSGLVESSITISVSGSTGVTTTYNNGVVTVVFSANEGPQRNITITINGTTTGGQLGIATINYVQEEGVAPSEYLTFIIESGGTIYWRIGDVHQGATGSTSRKTIQYSLNNGEWVSIKSASGSSAPSISVSSGDIVRFKGTNNSYGGNSYIYYNHFYGTTCQFSVKGNIMSLIYGDNFANQTVLVSADTFCGLFQNCTGLTNANNLILQASTLESSCYWGMFYGCTSLTTAPELPATTLAQTCYAYMFSGCTSLTTAPALPATTLASDCYNNMFNYCTGLTTPPALPATTMEESCYVNMFYRCISLTSAPALPATVLAYNCYAGMFYSCKTLTTAPELPATTLANRCYSMMFNACTNLTTAPELPATTLPKYCYEYMFAGCTSLTTAPELPATTLARSCYSSMFSGCTSLAIAPELPATTLASYCYALMFQDCTSLTTAPELPATTLAYECYGSMFGGCTNLTTAPELPATTLGQYCYYYMFYGCTSLTTAPELPATTLADYCYYQMFAYCSSLTAAPELPATTLANHCYNGMFYGCTSLTTAPELPATTLVRYCYYDMFGNCTSLNYIKCLATDISASYCTSSWVNGVASTGTFVTPSSTNWTTGTSGIPTGWTRVNA